MRKLTFYQQKRRDGGTRTGVTLDDAPMLHQFEDRADEADPALLWYVDLRCELKHLEEDAEEVRQWLLDQTPLVQSGFRKLANELSSGMDVDVCPIQWKVPGTPRGTRMTIVCSVTQRLEARDIGTVLRMIADRWESCLKNLPSVQPALQ